MLKAISKHVKIFSKNLLRFLILFSFYSLIICCNQSNSFYVISKEDSLSKEAHKNHDGIVLEPPKSKYAIYTFIVDSNDNAYFYSFPEEKNRAGIFDSEEPEFIELIPNNVFSIPQGMEKGFFESNVLFQKSSRPIKSVILASFRDTVRGDFLKYLKAVSSDKSNKVSLEIRLALLEEREVIKHKLAGQYYKPK